MAVKTDTHLSHLIRYNATGAMIFLEGSNRLEHRLSAKTEDAALEDAKAWIDEQRAERAGERRAPHIASPEEYAKAFGVLKPTAGKRLMLIAHSRADDRRMTPPQLADAAGWKSSSSATSHYAKMGKAVADLLGLDVNADDDKAYTVTLVSQDTESKNWEMHEEVAEGLRLASIA